MISENNISYFPYTPFGRRILKISKPCTAGVPGANTIWTYTYYVNDASGNVMATYSYDKGASAHTMTLDEQMVYGSSRLGLRDRSKLLSTFTISGSVLVHTSADETQRTLGSKRYEYSNHLGNVLLVTTDRKMSKDPNTNGTTDYYHCVVDAYYDYGPFGNVLHDRKNDGYRYGFNGQEKDDEMYGNDDSYNFSFRMYDPRLGRFMKVDPLASVFAYNSPYAFCENRVIDGRDWEGLEYETAGKDAVNFYGITSYDKVKGSFASWIGKGYEYFYGKTSDCLTSCLIVYATANTVVAEYLKNIPISPIPVINYFKHNGKYKESGQHHSFIEPKDLDQAKMGDILYIELPGSFDDGYVDHAVILASDPTFSEDGKTMTVDVHTTGGSMLDGTDSKNFGLATYSFTRSSTNSDDWAWVMGSILGVFRVDELGIIKDYDNRLVPTESLEKMPSIEVSTIPTERNQDIKLPTGSNTNDNNKSDKNVRSKY